VESYLKGDSVFNKLLFKLLLLSVCQACNPIQQLEILQTNTGCEVSGTTRAYLIYTIHKKAESVFVSASV